MEVKGIPLCYFVELLRMKMMGVIISQPHSLPISPKGRQLLVKEMDS